MMVETISEAVEVYYELARCEDKTLDFKSGFYDAIVKQVKKATIRMEHQGLCSGDNVKLTFDGEHSLDARVLSVERVRFRNITDEHAELEGYSEASLLKMMLEEIYPEVNDESELYFIKFYVINY